MTEHDVARGMTVGVVQALEVVEVHQHDRERALVAGGTGNLLVHAGEHRLPVRDAGELVHRGQPPGVGDALGEAREGCPEAGIGDPVGVDVRQRRIVRGVPQTLDQARDPAVLPSHDEDGEAGRPGQGADERDDKREDQDPGDGFHVGGLA